MGKILCITILAGLFLMVGCYQEEIEIQTPTVQWKKAFGSPSEGCANGTLLGLYYSFENTAPDLAKIVEPPGDRIYFYFGSPEVFKAWWEELHPFQSWLLPNGQKPLAYIAFTGKYELWIPAKQIPGGGIISNPWIQAHEEGHYLAQKDIETDPAFKMLDPHDWLE